MTESSRTESAEKSALIKSALIKSALGFDFGTRNIGVAYGQAISGTATELPVLRARDGVPNWDKIAQLIEEWQPDAVVVGIPLNMDGSESNMSLRARKFGKRLHGRFGLPFFEVDERLSSFEAKQQAQLAGHSGHYRSQPVDGMAARILLESWFRCNEDGKSDVAG